MKSVDLFAGSGIVSYVLKNNGIESVLLNDFENHSKIICENNGFNKFRIGDINNVEINEIPKHDILCGGFPCQPFSIAGEKKGFNDERSNVFWKIIKILQHYQPGFSY